MQMVGVAHSNWIIICSNRHHKAMKIPWKSPPITKTHRPIILRIYITAAFLAEHFPVDSNYSILIQKMTLPVTCNRSQIICEYIRKNRVQTAAKTWKQHFSMWDANWGKDLSSMIQFIFQIKNKDEHRDILLISKLAIFKIVSKITASETYLLN